MESSSAPPPPNAVATKKQPPPEKPEAVSLRTKIVISFWAVILLLGLPTWWQTTSIYRANLPLQDMVNWAEGFVRNDRRSWGLQLTLARRILLPLFPCTSGFSHQASHAPTRSGWYGTRNKSSTTSTNTRPCTRDYTSSVVCRATKELAKKETVRTVVEILQIQFSEIQP